MSLGRVEATPTVIDFVWDWEIIIHPVPGRDLPDEDIPIMLWGNAQVLFQDPDPFFDFGSQASPLPLPPSAPPTTIPIEIVQLDLTGFSPVLGNVQLGLQSGQPSIGAIQNLQNSGGNLTADSFFDVFVELNLPDLNETLTNREAIRVGMNFTEADGIPAIDVFWLPIWFWAEFPVNSPELVDALGLPWDTVVQIHAHQTPEPATLALFGIGLAGLAAMHRRRRRTFRC